LKVPVTDKAADRINAMTPRRYKTYEDRLRRMARRQGLNLLKSRRRDPRAYDYNGYMLADENDRAVAGHAPHTYSMSIDEIEKYLAE
jgi:hypothetical protein